MSILNKFFGIFRTVQAPSVLIQQEKYFRGDSRVCDPVQSFLGIKSHWWMFDYDGRVSKIIPENQGVPADVFTDRHFVMYNHTTGETPYKVFRTQVNGEYHHRPARLKGRVYLLPSEVIRELDGVYKDQVDSIRTRTRLVFPDYVTDFPKTIFDKCEPTTMHAWMYFDQVTPKIERQFKFDNDHFRGKGHNLIPMPIQRHPKEHIANYYDTGGERPKKTEGYVKLEIHKGSRKVPQVS
jgi:hypothetical protein